MSGYKFDGRYLLRVSLYGGPGQNGSHPPALGVKKYTLRCLVEWLPGTKRYRVAYLLAVPGLVREELVSRTRIGQWLADRQAEYLGKTHQLHVH